MATQSELDQYERDALAQEKDAQATPAQALLECKADELSTNFYWIFGKHEMFNIQTTIRGNPTVDEINAHIAAAINGMKLAINAGGHAKQVGYHGKANSAPPETSAVEAAIEVGKAILPPPSAAPSGGGNVTPCAMIEVGTAYKSGKLQLKFHCDGMEHPLTFTKEVADMVKLLAPIGGYTPAHLTVGKKYSVSALVVWEQGEKYKNVVAVRPQ